MGSHHDAAGWTQPVLERLDRWCNDPIETIHKPPERATHLVTRQSAAAHPWPVVGASARRARSASRITTVVARLRLLTRVISRRVTCGAARAALPARSRLPSRTSATRPPLVRHLPDLVAIRRCPGLALVHDHVSGLRTVNDSRISALRRRADPLRRLPGLRITVGPGESTNSVNARSSSCLDCTDS